VLARALVMMDRCAAQFRVIVLLGAMVGCGNRQAPPRMPPPPEVGVVTVTPQTVPETYEFVGQVTPFRRVEVRSRVDGIVEQRPFTEGSVVTEGQVLYRLDRVRYEAAYQSALAHYDNAKRTLQRLEPLLPARAVAQQDVDNARSTLESAKAELDQAKKDLDDTIVRAGITGRVGRARLELGARVTGPADLLTTIDQLDPLYVTFRPSTQQLLAWGQDPNSRKLIQPGSTLAVRVVLADSSLLPQSGRLNFIAPSLDSATGTQEFRAEFGNKNRELVPGQYVRVRLVGFTRPNALTVPQRAVQQGLGRQFVYVVGRGDTATARDVQPGPWSGNLWLIDHGLTAGDRVIVDGTQKVAPGRPVRPVPLSDSARTAPRTAEAPKP
jgi:membrane fusion protein (multidrug efflux system)